MAGDVESALVVGGGITGLSAAILLARRGVAVELWDAADAPGGLLAPVTFEGVACDRGSHRVHPESHPLLREMTRTARWRTRPRRGHLVMGGRHVPYPPDPLGFLRGLGPGAALSMGLGWLARPAALLRFARWERARGRTPHDDEGFEDFVVRRVGRSAYERFYRPYVEKVWGLDPGRVSRTVAKQRVSTSDPLRVLLRAFGRGGGGTFLYPRGGMASLIDLLVEETEDLGVRRRGGARVDRASIESGDLDDFDAVLFGGALEDLVPEIELGHRGLYLLHLAFERSAIEDAETDTWYAPETELWFGRVSRPEHFSAELSRPEVEILCVEIPEGRWGRGRDFTASLEAIIDQLCRAGILRAGFAPSAARQTFIDRVYPMYTRGWFGRWQRALDDVSRLGPIFPIGRQGLFLHCNMDHCVRIASEAVTHVLEGGRAGAWVDRCESYLDLRVRD